MKTDFEGDYLAFYLTGGEKGDAPHFPILLGLGPDVRPRAGMGDKGYDSRPFDLASLTRWRQRMTASWERPFVAWYDEHLGIKRDADGQMTVRR